MQNQYFEQTEEQEIKLTDYLHIISRYKWLVLTIFLVVILSAFYYTMKSPRIYKATSTILLETSKTSNFLFSPMMTTQTTLNNNIEILKSRPVMSIAYQILQQHPNFESFPINIDKGPGFDPINYFKNIIDIDSQRETDILSISFESTNPKEAMALANAAANALMQQDTDYARIEFKNVREFLENRLDENERRLRTSEEDLRAYKIEHGISMLSEETMKLIERSSDLELILSSAETELEIAIKHLTYLTSELTAQDDLLSDVNSILTSPLLEQLRNEIVANQTKYFKFLTKAEYTPDHPELLALNEEIENAKIKLNKEIQQITTVKAGTSDPLIYRSDLIQKISTAKIDQNIAESKVENLRKIAEEYSRKMTTLPDTEVDLARLQRNYSINEKTYSMLIEKYEDAKIAEKSKIGIIRMVEEAQTPKNPIKPNKKMNMIIAFVLGAGLGIGLAFLLHSLDSKIRTFDDVRKYVSLQTLGTIPYITVHDADLDYIEKMMKQSDGKERDELATIRQQMEAKIITHYAPKSSTSESFRMLRTNIVSRKEPNKPLSFLISSSGPKEGKTTIISNLAVTLSQMDERVILVDLDLRRPLIHKLFDFEKENGISDLLMDKSKKIETIIRKSKIPNLDIITCGYIPPNPSELLSSKRLDEVLSYLKQKYDYIMLDSPPTMAVTDSMIIATKVDIRALVVRISQADKVVVKRIKEMLENINMTFTGAIINGIHPQKYYSRYEYNYYYYYYYGKEELKKNGNISKISRKDKSVSGYLKKKK